MHIYLVQKKNRAFNSLEEARSYIEIFNLLGGKQMTEAVIIKVIESVSLVVLTVAFLYFLYKSAKL